MRRRLTDKWRWACLIGALVLILPALDPMQASAQPVARRIVRGVPNAQGQVNLPYQSNDNTGSQWWIYDGGWCRQQSNNGGPVYSQGGMLTINGNGLGGNNQGTVDAKTGELVIENLNAGGVCTVTRHILIDRDNGYVRYIDVLKNTQNAEQQINYQIQSNLNYGVNQSTMVPDPKRKGNNIAWVAQIPINKAAVEVYAGKGAKTVPTINYQQGNNVVQCNLQITLGAGKEVAVMHLHMVTGTMDQGTKWVNDFKESKMLQSIPPNLRRLIVNFAGGTSFIGDVEVLRGDVFDIVELRGGDQVKGTVKETTLSLDTFYGTVDLPTDRVVGIINVGQYRPRQLVVLSDGQVFGGRLKKDSIAVELSSGQVTQIPVSQINRVGYRKRAGEPEEWTFDRPMVLMRSGDRVAVQPVTRPVEVTTRYGVLDLPPQALAAVVFQSEDNAVHQIMLTDGSKFAGLVSLDEFEMQLAGTGSGGEQTVKFPTSGMLRLQLTNKVSEPDDDSPILSLMNDDALVGSLTGQLKLDTQFDTITVDATQIRHITRSKDAGLDVQVTLWDGTAISGQLQEQDVSCQLACGLAVKVPVSLLQEYNQPTPRPSGTMIEKVKAAVADLDNQEWQTRDRAQAALIGMGPAIAGVLKDLRPSQTPEAQGRIDEILKELDKSKPASATPANGVGVNPSPVMQPQFLLRD
jgi:hypothetical protein